MNSMKLTQGSHTTVRLGMNEAKGQFDGISIYGQESNRTTRRLAIMSLGLRGIDADFGPENAGTFRSADYVFGKPKGSPP